VIHTEAAIEVSSVWKGEAALAELVRQVFPDAQRQYAAPWLRGQTLDVYVPSVRLAFEYQGQQHYEPVNFFGGTESFRRTQERDSRKAVLCLAEGVTLIAWPYRINVSLEALRTSVMRPGILWPG
jgi:hypothetical protein